MAVLVFLLCGSSPAFAQGDGVAEYGFCSLCGKLQKLPHDHAPSGGGGESRSGPTPEERANAINNEGVELSEAGDLEGALRKYERALRISPQNATIRGNIQSVKASIANRDGIAAWNKGDYIQAAELFREAVRHDPANETLRKNLAAAEPEAERQRIHREHLASAKLRIDEMLDGLSRQFKITAPVVAGTTLRPITELRASSEMSQVQEIMRGLKAIKVPPPIPAEGLTLDLAAVALDPESAGRMLDGVDKGVAALELAATYKGVAILPPQTQAILIAGNAFLDTLQAADVYIVEKNESYELALALLKDPARRGAFARAVHLTREGKELPPGTDPEIARGVKALNDPALSRSGTRIACDALMTPKALQAGFTSVFVALLSSRIGDAAGERFKALHVDRDPVYREAVAWLSKARAARSKAKNPGVVRAIDESIALANKTIEASYALDSQAVGTLVSTFSGRKLEDAVEEGK